MKAIGVEAQDHPRLLGERRAISGTNWKSTNSFQTWKVVTKKS